MLKKYHVAKFYTLLIEFKEYADLLIGFPSYPHRLYCQSRGQRAKCASFPNLTFTVAIRCTATRLCRNRCHLAIPLSLSISQDSQELLLCLSFVLLALLLAKSYCGENAQVCLAIIRLWEASEISV